MVKSFIRALRGWPTSDLSEVFVAIKRILDERAAHHVEGGGIKAELAKRNQGKHVAGRSSK